LIGRRAQQRLGLGAILLAAACGGSVKSGTSAAPAPPSRASAAPAPTFALTDRDVEIVVRDVSVARQLAPRHPISVTRLEQRRFVEQLLSRRDSTAASEELTPEAAVLVGFDFVPPPSKRGEVATIDDVLKEQVVGFYDRDLDKVFVPDVRLKSEDDLFEQRAVLAHEVQHALQAQHFARLRPATSSDEAIAHLALLEGDAMVAMGALLGAEAGAPVGRTLRRIAEVTKRVPLSNVTRGEERKQLDKALDVTRKRLEFPYQEGMLFVSDIYRTGGFPLVDRMYVTPPQSTAQILHPEKYLAGELPRPIADPKLPGYAAATIDTLGELDTRILLSRCLDPVAAERAAKGWAGDRFGVFVGAERRLSVAWISAWDSEADAEELEGALSRSDACFHDNALGLSRSDYQIGAAFHVRRRGKLVSFLRGFPGAALPDLENQLFALVGPESRPSPVSALELPPRVRLPEPKPGHLDGDVYQSEWLGLVGRIPSGMAATVAGEHLDLLIDRPDVLVQGGLVASTRIASDEQNEKTFQEVQDAFVTQIGKVHRQVQSLGGHPVQTALGNGIERTWRVAGSSVELRLVLIPICAGTGSVVFIQAYGDPFARSVLDGWMGSFRWTHGRNLVACDYLDPK
jgi:hypothetical protein